MTPSATALVDLLAAEDSGFQSPTLEEFYPEPLFSFSVAGSAARPGSCVWTGGPRRAARRPRT